MRIGILGNMNNAYFALTRYLRDAGFDCELFIFKNEPHHFDPACDTRSNDYKKYCRHVTWGDPGDFLKEDFNKIKQELATFDFLIGNGSAPAYVNKIGRKLDIFIPYGYDVYSLPFFRIVHPLRQPAYIAVAYYQRRGIKESSYILFDRTNQAFEAIFNKISINGKRIISPSPMLYYKEYEHEAEQLSEEDALDKQLKRLRRENDLLFVQHTRQLWKNSPDYWSYKGNNLLIEGYAQFKQQYPDLRSKLILFEYGNGVADSKKLISRLNIQNVIVWMPKMPRKKLMHVLSHADLVIGELHHSWLTYGVVMEALSMEKPFMHKRNDHEYVNDYPELYPMINAYSVESVVAGLNKFVEDKDDVMEIGVRGKQWFIKYCVEYPLNTIIQIIKEKQAIHFT